MERRTRLAAALDEALTLRKRDGVTQRELGEAIAARENRRRLERRQHAFTPAELRSSAMQWQKRLSAWRTAASTPATADLLLQAAEVVAPGTPRSLWLELWDDARAATRARAAGRRPGVPDVRPATVTDATSDGPPDDGSPDDGSPDDGSPDDGSPDDGSPTPDPAPDVPRGPDPLPGGPPSRRRPWTLGLVAAAALTLVTATAAGGGWPAGSSAGTVRRAAATAPAAGAAATPGGPSTVSFDPAPGNWTDWVYGPSLGTTPGASQEVRATVHGLVHGDAHHAVGFRLRSGVDRDGRRTFLIARIDGVTWQVELQSDAPGGWIDHGAYSVQGDGVLEVTISETDRLRITYCGVRIADVQIPAGLPPLTGREIFPAAFQGGPPWAELRDIRSNARRPAAALPSTSPATPQP